MHSVSLYMNQYGRFITQVTDNSYINNINLHTKHKWMTGKYVFSRSYDYRFIIWMCESLLHRTKPSISLCNPWHFTYSLSLFCNRSASVFTNHPQWTNNAIKAICQQVSSFTAREKNSTLGTQITVQPQVVPNIHSSHSTLAVATINGQHCTLA